jgi:phage terminase small subunit
MSTFGTNPVLSTKQRRAIEALLSTGDVTAAAKEARVGKSSLYRWLREPVFLAAVREAETAALDELSRMLVRLGRTAVGTLAKEMSDPKAPWPTRVRAADASLARLLQLRELATLEARVTELERSVGLGKAGR